MMRPLVLALLVLLAGVLPAAAAAVDHREVVGRLNQAGEALVAAYDPATGESTADRFSDLYFNVFEESGLEADIGAADAEMKTLLESRFGTVIGLAMNAAPREQVSAAWSDLRQGLSAAAEARAQAEQGWIPAFLQALLILLREGFEAILVIGALVAYLKRLGAEDRVRVVWQAVWLALGASLITAWALNELIRVSGPAREALEGATMLVAAIVLAYVSHWLFARREAARWQGYIREQVERALSGGQMFSLGFAAFLAVYREGAETVLFTQALLAGAPGQGMAVAAGLAAGAAGLVVMYQGMRRASMKLPLGVFFTGTAVLLYGLAVVFAGAGVLELQEARWLPSTPLAWAPRVPTLGLFPTAETLAAQGMVLALLLPVVALWAIRRRRAAR